MFYGVFHFIPFCCVKYSLSRSVSRLCATLYVEQSYIFFSRGFIFVTRKLEFQSVEFTSSHTK